MLKVGLCGFGSMAKGHAQMLKLHQDVELVAIADKELENRQKAEEQYGVKTYESGEELIEAGGVDVVFVVVPTYLHAPMTIQALNAGCHVFCEKPMSLNPQLCQDMIEASRKNNKMLMIGQVLRFWPEYVYLKKTIAEGTLGKLSVLTMRRVGAKSFGWQNWFLKGDLGGSQLFDRHIHDTDAIQWMLGTPKEVYTFGTTSDPKNDGGFFHTVTEYFYDNNVLVSAEGSADSKAKIPFTASYHAVFEKGVIIFNSTQKPTLKLYDENDEPMVPELPSGVESLKSGMNITHAGPYFYEQAYFFDCIRRNIWPETVTPAMAKESIRIALAECESAMTHARVKL